MNNKKVYKIKGMHCESCVKLIKMELDDAGFNLSEVNLEKKKLEIPEEYKSKIQEIKEAVKRAGEYEVL